VGRTIGVLPITVLWTLAAGWSAPSAPPGTVYVQIQCGTPPEIAPTSHTIELWGDFWPDAASRLALVPLAGRIDALRVDGRELTAASPEIQGGFLVTEELGRIFLAAARDAPGYRAVVRFEQTERLSAMSPDDGEAGAPP